MTSFAVADKAVKRLSPAKSPLSIDEIMFEDTSLCKPHKIDHEQNEKYPHD
jgi:hypothetical protein